MGVEIGACVGVGEGVGVGVSDGSRDSVRVGGGAGVGGGEGNGVGRVEAIGARVGGGDGGVGKGRAVGEGVGVVESVGDRGPGGGRSFTAQAVNERIVNMQAVPTHQTIMERIGKVPRQRIFVVNVSAYFALDTRKTQVVVIGLGCVY